MQTDRQNYLHDIYYVHSSAVVTMNKVAYIVLTLSLVGLF